jgi:hypothetical protein
MAQYRRTTRHLRRHRLRGRREQVVYRGQAGETLLSPTGEHAVNDVGHVLELGMDRGHLVESCCDLRPGLCVEPAPGPRVDHIA